jgi:Tfp pilus assembly protein PilF
MLRRTRGSRIAATAMMALMLVGCNQTIRHKTPRPPKPSAGELKPEAVADVQVSLARSFEEQGDVDKAMSAYREASRRDPSRADAPLRLAVLLDQAGRFAESPAYYDAALKASPGNAEIFCDRGYSLALQGRDSEAEAMYRQAIAKQPDLARAHNNLGVLLGRTNHPNEALAAFRKAGCLESDAHLNLAFALSLAHKYDEARTHLAIARDTSPNSPQLAESAKEIETLIACGSSAVRDSDILRASATQTLKK